MSTDDRRPVRSASGGSRPAGSRPQGSRPSGSRPQGSRPQGSRPQGSRPQGSRPQGSRPSGNRPQGTKKKSGVGKIVLIVIEVVALVALGLILWKVVIPATKTGKVDLPEEDIIINEEVKAQMETISSGDGDGNSEAVSNSSMNGYRNIALFGVDSREKELTKNTRSDTIIIASINEETGAVKLCSVYRDSYLNLSNDSYNKCNAAYAKGGPKQAINMLNMNLDMNITDFITIGFDGLADVVDAVGGVEVDIKEAEIVHLNNYQISMVGKSSDGETFTATEGSDYTAVKSAGRQTLNGLQATAYCRIRYVGNDFERTERQRRVIMAVVEKAKQNPAKITGAADSLFEEVYTSLDLSEILEILGNIGKYEIVDQAGFPQKEKLAGLNMGSKGSCLVPLTLEENVQWLHGFLFDDPDYEPSGAVKSYSQQIVSDASPYM